jgi:hypothetical protein
MPVTISGVVVDVLIVVIQKIGLDLMGRNKPSSNGLLLQYELRFFYSKKLQGFLVMILLNTVLRLGINKNTGGRTLSFLSAKIIIEVNLITGSIGSFHKIHSSQFLVEK